MPTVQSLIQRRQKTLENTKGKRTCEKQTQPLVIGEPALEIGVLRRGTSVNAMQQMLHGIHLYDRIPIGQGHFIMENILGNVRLAALGVVEVKQVCMFTVTNQGRSAIAKIIIVMTTTIMTMMMIITWATTKREESKIEVNEMRMLRWMCGVTRKDKIRNEHIRGTTKVVQASRKITERRLKWYGHVMRMEEDHVVRRVMTKEIPGKRKRGRPKTRWKDVCNRDMQTVGLREGDD